VWAGRIGVRLVGWSLQWGFTISQGCSVLSHTSPQPHLAWQLSHTANPETPTPMLLTSSMMHAGGNKHTALPAPDNLAIKQIG